ncbi:MAG: ABC transporter ATP-binding protein [Solirubrobacteraceae bacterium]
MTAAARPALELTGVHAGYGRYDVVRGIDLHVGEGEAVALLGPNGAGKSTLLRAVMGQLKHRRGSVRVSGEEISKLPTHRIARGYAALAPEGRRLFWDLSVEDNLILGAFHLRHEQARVTELLHSVYELFPVLERYRQRRSTSLSGGEQQMVAIGRMLMTKPSILLLDEPSDGLAPLAVAAVADALAELRRQGRSLLMVEQRVDLATRFCDRVYVLVGGEVVLEEDPASLDVTGRDMIERYLG